MSQASAAGAVQALPCAACKQPVIEKRSLDGAVVVLDAATKRLHLCLKRKEADAAKAKQMASRPRPVPPAKPRPPVKRVQQATPVVAAAAPPQRKHGKPRKQTLRSPAQVQKILESKIMRWRTGDGPTSFCDTCGAPVLVGFSPVRWDVIMVDAAGHRPHDCEVSRREAAARRETPMVADVPELPAVEPARRAIRVLAPTAAAEPVAKPAATPRRRPKEKQTRVADNSCESCGNLKALVNGAWVCLHCA